MTLDLNHGGHGEHCGNQRAIGQHISQTELLATCLLLPDDFFSILHFSVLSVSSVVQIECHYDYSCPVIGSGSSWRRMLR